jgi:hypothetical protein
VAKEMANANQTVEAEAKTQQSTILKQQKGSEYDGKSGVAAISGGWQRRERQCCRVPSHELQKHNSDTLNVDIQVSLKHLYVGNIGKASY